MYRITGLYVCLSALKEILIDISSPDIVIIHIQIPKRFFFNFSLREFLYKTIYSFLKIKK